MNAHTFDSHSVPCPICNRFNSGKQGTVFSGLVFCQYCRERLVISWSGHYVRDPFSPKPLETEQMLRRQSRPLARLFRDFGLAKQPSWLTLVGSLLLVGGILSGFGAIVMYESLHRLWMPQSSQNTAKPFPPGKTEFEH